MSSCPERFLSFNLQDSTRFLTSGPKKIHIHHVLEALMWANIAHVNIYVFGMKKNWESFTWLEQVTEHNPDAKIVMDVGWYITVQQGEDICLVKPKSGHRFPGGEVSTFPMLASYQRTSIGETYGTLYFSGREGDGEIKKVKIYSTLGHALKAFGRATNFGTRPKTVRQMQRRVSQAREFLHFSHGFDMFGEIVTKTRVKVTIKKTATTLNKAWQVGTEIVCGCDALLIPVGPYGDEAQLVLDIAATHSSTHGRVTRRLDYVEKVYAAHLLNAFGVCTVDILMHLTGVGGGDRYPWEPQIPVDVAVSAVPPASTWDEIVQHVWVTRAP